MVIILHSRLTTGRTFSKQVKIMIAEFIYLLLSQLHLNRPKSILISFVTVKQEWMSPVDCINVLLSPEFLPYEQFVVLKVLTDVAGGLRMKDNPHISCNL